MLVLMLMLITLINKPLSTPRYNKTAIHTYIHTYKARDEKKKREKVCREVEEVKRFQPLDGYYQIFRYLDIVMMMMMMLKYIYMYLQ